MTEVALDALQGALMESNGESAVSIVEQIVKPLFDVRSYCENKRFKKSQTHTVLAKGTEQDSQCLQNYYKHYQNDQQQHHQPMTGTISKEPSPSGPLK